MDLDNTTALYLLKRVGLGDQDAFATLHRALGRRIFAFAMRHLHSPEAAEEVVADTMFEVWKNPGRFNGTSKLSTWVLGIARYRILNRLRANAHEMESLTPEVEETISCEAESAFERIANEQRETGVRTCMEKLSAKHRECMHLVFYEGLALGEVATLQGCPENTVKTRLFHARKSIQNCLRLLLRREDSDVAQGVTSHA
ncbi:RNA polymerase sigma factor [Tahibacter amnicola]|uniref:Sigma-70 family RNA polymerase sigma factor n=1 Tax=Tahibacter amnicola TaxID=2976241 RepID=A0ABY6BEN7_9GAMM|nr:sigma-70 family RNA polymerase sigma factor [Tahibacter amnicola]UXI68498.1 sigma-70 family RNA polymerase sigma factor [Tahibacter amnicola]